MEPTLEAGTQLSLTFRVPLSTASDDDTINGILEFGRESIVRAFTDLTTEHAHIIWERYQ
jgi:hypothetical protein